MSDYDPWVRSDIMQNRTGQTVNDKPLRQEDYMAMAEENQRLLREIDRLKPKPKPKRRDLGMFIFISLVVVFLSFMIGMIYVEGQPPGCWMIKQYNQPWDFYRYKVIGRKFFLVPNIDTEQRFPTREEARQFMSDWRLNECTK